MEEVFYKNIFEIIELLENNDVPAYYYNKNKFHIIDKKRLINFEVVSKNNEFSIKDNQSGIIYMCIQKYLNDDITFQQVYIDDELDKSYYAFLEEDTFVKLVTYAHKNNNECVVCKNNYVHEKSLDEIINYATEVLEEDISNSEYDIDNEEEVSRGFYKDSDDSIEDIGYYEDEEYMDELIDSYNNYYLKLNGKHIPNVDKTVLIPQYELEIEKVYCDSIKLKEAVGNLKIVLDAIQRKNEYIENER